MAESGKLSPLIVITISFFLKDYEINSQTPR